MGALVLGTAGAVIGSYFGPVGAQIGWAIGSSIGARASAKDQKSQGPRLTDLKIPGVQYGDTIPYIKGRYRTAGQIWWASSKREIATTTSQETGGKGGGPTVEQTTYTYEIDLLIGLTDNEIAGVPRAWMNGKLVYNGLSSTSQAALLNVPEDAGFIVRALANVTASQNTALWRRFTVYTGTDSQLPDPTYEAAEGANAVAYRHRSYVFIEGLQLGGAPAQLPNLEFEVCTKATGGAIDATVLLQMNFASDFEDLSAYEASVTVQDTFSIENGRAKLSSGADVPNNAVYSGAGFDDVSSPETSSYTAELFFESPAGNGSAGDCPILVIVDGAGPVVDTRLAVMKQTTGDYNKLRLRNGGTQKLITTGTVTDDTEQHICLMFRGSADGTPHLWIFIDGVLAGELSSPDADLFHLPSALSGGQVWVGGSPSVAPIFWDDVRLKLGLEYNTAGFDPPVKPLPLPDESADTLTPADEDLEDFFEETWALCGGHPNLVDTRGLTSRS